MRLDFMMDHERPNCGFSTDEYNHQRHGFQRMSFAVILRSISDEESLMRFFAALRMTAIWTAVMMDRILF
jgi:hypothetical protein